MDKQPEKDSVILQIDRPYRNEYSFLKNDYQHCNMGMRIHNGFGGSFSDFIEVCKNTHWPLPDFFWCYVVDFHHEYPVLGGCVAAPDN